MVSALVAFLHIAEGYFGLFYGSPRIPLTFALPVTVFLLVATGLGFWLGWIMATTKEPESVPAETIEEEEPEELEE